MWQCRWAWLLSRHGPLQTTGSVGRLAGAAVGALAGPRVLFARDGDAPFTMCFMLVMTCTPGAKSAIFDFLVIFLFPFNA